ncbi:LuxR C-terminal-related transcriptional regulator [Streptomyces rubiginosohelvolus]|uniref:helix-turn-helix transcriptional regulator n=1 Tax=Streptomyces rubiginosohelvolus TaxID=67362 RepID=UPI00342F30F3
MQNPAVSGIVIRGATGSGKSRLGSECLSRVRGQGVATASVVATAASQDVPLSALAPLLSPFGGSERLTQGSAPPVRLQPSLRRVQGRPSAVVLVDNFHFVDQASRDILLSLMRSGELRVIATMSDEPELPHGVWPSENTGTVLTVRTPPLDEQAVNELLGQVLSGIVEQRSSRLLHTTSRGLPLYLVELVHHAASTGSLNRESGMWRLSQEITPPARLSTLVMRQLSRITERERKILEDLALGGPEARDTFPLAAVLRLTERGLVQARQEAGRSVVALADPVHGLVLRATTPVHRARQLLLSRAERAEKHPSEERDPLLATTLWRLQANDQVPVERLERAVTQARSVADFPAAHRLAQALVQQRPDEVSYLLLGEFSFECGEHLEADAALQKAMHSGADEDIRLRSLVLRTMNLAQGMMRSDDAFTINSEVRATVTGRETKNALDANEAALWCFAGHVRNARDLIASLDQRETGELTQIMVDPPRAYVLSESGHQPTPHLWTENREPPAQLLIEGEYLTPQVVLDGTRARALAEAGDLSAAMSLAQSAYERAVSARARTVQYWPALHLGWICYLRGDIAGAKFWFATVVALSKEQSFLSGLWSGLCGQALVSAVTGDLSDAVKALSAAESLQPRQWWRPEVHTVQGWQLAAEGKLTSARTELMKGARAAEASGLEVTKSQLLFDVVRLGGIDEVHGELGRTLVGTDNPFVALRLRSAHALAQSDAIALELCAEQLAGMGALLLAAEVCTWAATLLFERGEQQSATRLGGKIHELVQGCGGQVHTPGLAPPFVRAALTNRELEIAMLAASGLANAQIAGHLDISIRTAANHLQRVYTKLGISDRRQVAEVLTSRPRRPGR